MHKELLADDPGVAFTLEEARAKEAMKLCILFYTYPSLHLPTPYLLNLKMQKAWTFDKTNVNSLFEKKNYKVHN